MMSRSISQTTAAISQITTEITTTVMIKLNAPRTLLTSSQLKGRDTPKDAPARAVAELLTTLHGHTPPATCKLCEVATPVPVQRSQATQASPRPTDLLKRLGPSPLFQSRLTQLEEHSAAALVLGAHDLYAPLVDVASASPARNGVEDLYLFAVFGDNEMADVDEALVAGVGTQALETRVVRLYGVVVILSGWLRGCARLCGVHEAPPRGPGLGSW